jgi:hypothetical protein
MLLVNPFYRSDPWFGWRAERARAKLGRLCAAERGKDRLHARIIAWEPGKFRDEGVYLGVF